MLRRAFRVLFTTETERKLARQSFALSSWRSEIVPYGVLLPDTDSATLQAEFHRAVPQLSGKRFLLFLGRIDRKKGCDLLVEAFCLEAAQDPDLHLLMAGPDRDGWGDELRDLAERHGFAARIHWPGILRGSAKWGAFYASEAFILPSHQENFGIAVAEALACGRPVLISDQVNLAGTIEKDGCSLVEPDTIEGTRQLLRSWLTLTPMDRNAMSRNAIDCFQRRFDLRASVHTIMNLFKEAAQRRDTEVR